MSTDLLTLIGVAVTTVTAVTVAIINLYQNRKIDEVHFLVNDRLDKALAEIKRLETLLRELNPNLPL